MATAIIFLSLGKLIAAMPFLTFLGLAPLFTLFYNRQKEASAKLSLYVKIFIVLATTFLLWNAAYSNENLISHIQPVFHAIIMLLPFAIYGFTNKYARNRLGFFTIPIYWLALEYLLLQFQPVFAGFFLGSVFSDHPELISWNIYTGFLGVSLWILIINILLFYCVFKDNALFNGNIRWAGLIAAIIVTCVPFFLATDAIAITHKDLVSGGSALEKQAYGSSEFIGKTAVWISVLLLLYSFVKREVRTNERP
ncbi:apolipoprotein N-acyltransferase [Fulvivirga imtechensis AK7]|uniref:Apolipoprotein N-acyltransferase n=2 Tax=Fulvivirga TaxID=396811 RepID=L8JVF8_9BACT|nr:apolipoprotein N-acyltransferase [Fulvivirga imtechensis AK7]